MSGVGFNHDRRADDGASEQADGSGGAKHADHPARVTPATIHRSIPDDGRNTSRSNSRSTGNYILDSQAANSDTRTDEQLLSAYRTGDKRAFATLVSRYQRELFHFLVRFLGDRAAADDVFQEAFLQVHQSIEQFDPTRRFRPWLFTIAANKARDLIRSQARRPTNPLQASFKPSDDDSGEYLDLMQSAQQLPDEPLQQQELQQAVQRAVATMPENLREILLLSYFHQFPYKQISEILDIPLGTVKSRLHAAVAHFADRWKSTNQNKSVS